MVRWNEAHIYNFWHEYAFLKRTVSHFKGIPLTGWHFCLSSINDWCHRSECMADCSLSDKDVFYKHAFRTKFVYMSACLYFKCWSSTFMITLKLHLLSKCKIDIDIFKLILTYLKVLVILKSESFANWKKITVPC